MSDTSIIIKQCDSLVYLPELSLHCPGHFDLIVTDPPYWTLDKWRNMGTTTRLGGHRDKDKQDDSRWFPTIDHDDLWKCLGEFYTLLNKDSIAYVFADHEVMPLLLGMAREGGIGFTYSKPLVWDKVTPGMGYHWRAQTEFIVMLCKGKPQLRDRSRPDLLRYPKLKGPQYYPTEKPLDLIRVLIENSSDAGDNVLDPFCGSGVVGEACCLLGRNATLLDIETRAIQYTDARCRFLGSGMVSTQTMEEETP